MAARRSVSVYELKSTIEGVRVSDFDQVIDPETLTDVEVHDAAATVDAELAFEAKLYLVSPDPREPSWAEFLRDGFGEDVEAAQSAANSAAIVVRVPYRNAKRYFAFVFGMGRYLLRRDSYERGYGVKVALNLIYEDDDPGASTAPARVRRVDAKTVAQNTLRTSRQANRFATFETFGLDIQRDLLGGVTGEPSDKETWGARVVGRDSVHLSLPLEFRDLGALCKRLWRVARKRDYKARFEWIDNVRSVDDPDLLRELSEALIVDLRKGESDAFELAPPQIIDWETEVTFEFSSHSGTKSSDLVLTDYLENLQSAGTLDELAIADLKRHRARALDGAGEVIHEWPVFRCLSGEIERSGKTYLLDEGAFFEIDRGYLAELDSYVGALTECPVDLPASQMIDEKEQTEGDYNIEAANASANHLLLDKETVKVTTRTSPIEICDVLTADRQFIHVKRKLQSSQLSHLFSQGYVSADLLLMSTEYRSAIRQKVQEAEQKRVEATGDETFRGRFVGSLDWDAIDPSQIEVVYAIVAKWDGRILVDALPFFSKVNLRRHVDDLRRMGYRVSYKRIEVIP